MSKRRNLFDEQQAIAFRYHEQLSSIVRDLENLDRLIPAESSRHGCLSKNLEAAAIIEGRKNDLLGYIQTICRDHVHYSKRLMESGWIAKGRKSKRESAGEKTK